MLRDLQHINYNRSSHISLCVSLLALINICRVCVCFFASRKWNFLVTIFSRFTFRWAFVMCFKNCTDKTAWRIYIDEIEMSKLSSFSMWHTNIFLFGARSWMKCHEWSDLTTRPETALYVCTLSVCFAVRWVMIIMMTRWLGILKI